MFGWDDGIENKYTKYNKRIKLTFGLSEHFWEMSWDKNLDDFPQNVIFKDKKWTLVGTSKPDKDSDFCKVFNFGEMSPSNPLYKNELPDVEKISQYEIRCTCGAIFTSFINNHMFYCPKHKKDERL